VRPRELEIVIDMIEGPGHPQGLWLDGDESGLKLHLSAKEAFSQPRAPGGAGGAQKGAPAPRACPAELAHSSHAFAQDKRADFGIRSPRLVATDGPPAPIVPATTPVSAALYEDDKWEKRFWESLRAYA